MVGYSKGAEYAHYFALKEDIWEIDNGFCRYKTTRFDGWRKEFGKMIRIGSPLLATEKIPLHPSMLSSVYEITGGGGILMA